MDPIERQDALDAICDNCDTVEASCPHYPCGRYVGVEKLPPAQPEIIRCKDCKHYKAYEYTGRLACHYVIGGVVVRNPDDFCSRAERTTEYGEE